ncbi:transmembrane protein 245 isoform X2 [Neocloeon triangulifer]|uniref:transmembrane protein 245 isoform X2 n=1 Tax=Neocloeon triangulifer TaxID=2078957 RepID=UPI00286F0C14|nr:transmembrane protein 245 isoform X2 [Neocloeon triangulifer]
MAVTPQSDYIKSPFEHVFNYLIPQGHEKALRHALYNALALFLLMVCTCVGYAVCCIMEPFMKPLLWALLCGSVLHPFKHSLVIYLKSWFLSNRDNSTPFLVGLAVTPVRMINSFSNLLGNMLYKHLIAILAIFGTTVTTTLAYHYMPRFIIIIARVCGSFTLAIINWSVSHLSIWLIICAVGGYAVLLLKSKSEMAQRRLSVVSCFLWLAVVCWAFTSLLNSNIESKIWNVTIFSFASLLLIVGLGVEVWETHVERSLKGSEASYLDTIKLVLLQEPIPELVSCREENEDVESDEAANEEVRRPEITVGDVKSPIPTASESFATPDTTDSRPHGKRLAFRNIRPMSLMSSRSGHITYFTSTPFRPKPRIPESFLVASISPPEGLTGNHCLMAVGWACLAMFIYKNTWLLGVVPLPLVFFFTSKGLTYFGVKQFVKAKAIEVWKIIVEWCKERETSLCPPPIKGVIKIVGRAHDYGSSFVENSIDMAASVVVIVGLIILSLMVTVFILIQIYGEGVHIVQTAAQFTNSTIVNNPELLQMLPEGISDAIKQVLDNAYQYGREGISNLVRYMIGPQVETARAAQLEQQVLELWDRLYQVWVMSSAVNDDKTQGPVVTSDAVLSSWDSLVSRLTTTPELLDFGAMTEWLKANMGTLTHVMASVWTLLKDNLSLFFGSLTTILSIVLGGGTAVLNFVLSMVVFLTALFYLLNSSGALYKPVELITNFSSTNGKRFGEAFEAAVNGVFKASFKMAVFYGSWTWLIHNLFHVKIVYLPSVLAAVLGAVPFLGTYWASLPATLELWLAQDRGFEAILLLVCHLLPASIVDTTIYSEIRGGGHPYLTGLAVAGGILCLGVEGAIIGPLLLCSLFVAVNMSGTLIKEKSEPTVDERTIQALSHRSIRR